MKNTSKHDKVRAIYAELDVDETIELCDYVILNGIRFNRETSFEEENRSSYEPGGKFAHLRGVEDH